jgi:tRNA/tmRNA/rRNA uracil-C5-methylase (TrmA/RlmC/RlmD family)
VEDVIADTLPADVVMLNPPRTGVDERVTETLAAAESSPVIVYVSCNPATLARDVQRLPRHRIASLTSFDMFPQTAHVETVCELVREDA